MMKSWKLMLIALLVSAIGANAFAEVKMKSVVASDTMKPSGKKERLVTEIALVQKIDLKNRVVTLKNDSGRIFDVKAGPQARNLPQLKIGDEVTVKYYEAVSIKVYKPGDAPQVSEETAVLERAKKGEKPGGSVAVQSTVTATIDTIDLQKQNVTLKTTEGKYLDVKVEDPKNLDNVKVGDEVVLTYTEALAISVQKVKKKSKK